MYLVFKYNMYTCSQGLPGLPGTAGLDGQKVAYFYCPKLIDANGFA